MLAKPRIEEPTAVCPQLPVRPRRRIDGSVEDQRPYSLREKVRVGGTEEGAPGNPPVGQSPIAHGAAQQVHVPGAVGGRHMSQKAAVGPAAAAAEAPVS